MTTRRTLLTMAPLLAFGMAGRVKGNPTVLRPEAFGAGRGDAARDTAGWAALAAAAQGLPEVVVEAQGQYRISGSSIVFEDVRVIQAHLAGARFQQTARLSRTLSFERCGSVEVHDGRFQGLGGGAGEFEGASSSWNGVAAVLFDDCDVVRVRRTQESQHAGGGFVVRGGRVRDFEGVVSQGIGSPWIDPIRQSNQGNGSDFSIMCLPGNAAAGWIHEHRFVNNRCRDHAFGIQVVQSRICLLQGNEIGPCPGQHGVYGIENDDVVTMGNTFIGTRQLAFKEQLENYAGQYIGQLWRTGVGYSVGDLVRHQERLLECVRSHRSGRNPVSANWRVSPLNTRKGGLFENNRIEDCGHGFGHMSTVMVDGREIVTEGWRVQDNAFDGVRAESIYMQRALRAEVLRNRIDTRGRSTTAAVFLTDFGGVVRENRIVGAGHAGILCSVATSARIEDNVIVDPGGRGVGVDQQTGVTLFAPDSRTTLPSVRRGGPRRATVQGNSVSWSRTRPPRAAATLSTDRGLGVEGADRP